MSFCPKRTPTEDHLCVCAIFLKNKATPQHQRHTKIWPWVKKMPIPTAFGNMFPFTNGVFGYPVFLTHRHMRRLGQTWPPLPCAHWDFSKPFSPIQKPSSAPKNRYPSCWHFKIWRVNNNHKKLEQLCLVPFASSCCFQPCLSVFLVVRVPFATDNLVIWGIEKLSKLFFLVALACVWFQIPMLAAQNPNLHRTTQSGREW